MSLYNKKRALLKPLVNLNNLLLINMQLRESSLLKTSFILCIYHATTHGVKQLNRIVYLTLCNISFFEIETFVFVAQEFSSKKINSQNFHYQKLSAQKRLSFFWTALCVFYACSVSYSPSGFGASPSVFGFCSGLGGLGKRTFLESLIFLRSS